MSRQICVITGSRADFGLLEPLLRELDNVSGVSLKLVATGSHLSPAFGLTYQDIEAAGFTIYAKIECLMGADTPSSINNSVAVGLMKFDGLFRHLRPDVVVVLGDRYEILAAVMAALFRQIPVAHISGGEQTMGAFDDSIRHAITKMSHFHFVSTERYRHRVIQLGEDPDRVFRVGALGIDNIQNLQILDREELAQKLSVRFLTNNLLVTFHPSTLEPDSGRSQLQALLGALSRLEDTCIIFTKANADPAGITFNQMVETFVTDHNASYFFASLGVRNYLSMVAAVDAVVGNSSSGIIEVPSLKTPTVNIGDRQLGRISADSVINCGISEDEISAALETAISIEFQERTLHTVNPYEGRDAGKKIAKILVSAELSNVLKKPFYDIPS